MTKASANIFPQVLIVEGTVPSNPSAGDQALYIDSTTHALTRVNSSGTVTSVEGSVGSPTLPTIVAIGSSATGTGAVTPGLPTGHTTNDILLLFVQSDNETATAPATYTQLGPETGIGTAAAALGTRLSIFWRRDGGSEAAPTVADTGDHTLAVIMGVRGCTTSGDPFVSVGQTRKTTASTTGTAMAGATTTDNCLVVNAFAHSIDTTSAVFSAWTNASLASITEQIDVSTTDGNGGGIGVATGGLTVAGAFVASTVTETSTTDVSSTFYMVPATNTSNVTRASRVDIQTFLTAGFADTWTKPSGAKSVYVVAIGGGSSGSAGRNGSVAAGGGGGGGGMFADGLFAAANVPATVVVTAGAGGAQTADSDGAASNAGNNSTFVASTFTLIRAFGAPAAGASSTGSGGLGANGGGQGTAAAAGVNAYGAQPPGGGTGGTTALAGGGGFDFAGGAGAGGGTSQAASAGGGGTRGGAGGGGGRSNTVPGTGGNGGTSNVGGAANLPGTTSVYPERGGGGGGGGGSGTGHGGAGGWPGGGGGGGGSQSGDQHGGAGGDGVVVVTTFF